MRLRLALALLVLLPARLYAWGGLGHRTVGLIAERRLSPAALAQVRGILGANTSLADISTCADEIKRKKVKCGSFSLNIDKRSSRWHYIDIPLNAEPTPETLRRWCKGHGREDQCSTEQIKRHLAILKDPKTDLYGKQIALMFVVHLVGDLHMPLHNADDSDRGGNAKLVAFMASARKSKKTNLHSIWDKMLMKDSEAKKLKPQALAERLEREIEGKNAASWTGGNIVDKAAVEAFGVAKTKIYPHYARTAGADLKGDYQKEMQPLAFEQVEKAGVRLAALLNEAWR